MKFQILSLVTILFATCPVHGSLFKDFFNPPPVKNYFVDLSFERAKYGYDSYTEIGGGLYLDPGTFKHFNNDVSFSLGLRRENNFGTQLSYTQVQDVTFNFDGGNTKQYVNSLLIESLYFVPIVRNLELKLLVGIGLYNIKFKTSYVANNISTYEKHTIDMGVAFGAGLQYNVTKHLAGNLMYKYQAPFDKIKYISGLSLGLVYNFCDKQVPAT